MALPRSSLVLAVLLVATVRTALSFGVPTGGGKTKPTACVKAGGKSSSHRAKLTIPWHLQLQLQRS